MPQETNLLIEVVGDYGIIAENKDGKLALKTDICAPEDVACEHLYVYKISK